MHDKNRDGNDLPDLCRTLERELTEAHAQIVALREDLSGKEGRLMATYSTLVVLREFYQHNWKAGKRPVNAEAQILRSINNVLDFPPPPVVALADVMPLVEISSEFDACANEDDDRNTIEIFQERVAAFLAKQAEEITALNFKLHAEMKFHLAAKARLADLEWRPVSVKPTETDASPRGYVIGLAKDGRARDQHIKGKFAPDIKWWMPFTPPPASDPADEARREFEAWAQAKPQLALNQGHGAFAEYFSSTTQAAWIGWQGARKEASNAQA